MHKTGKYKMLNLIFGIFPFVGATAICLINEKSGFIQSWFSIVSTRIILFVSAFSRID